MKNHNIQQEILLVRSAAFFSREYVYNENSADLNLLSSSEQMEEACWNGLLQGLLPEIFKTSVLGQKLYLWNVVSTEYLVQIDLSGCPVTLNKDYTIYPWFSVPTLSRN